MKDSKKSPAVGSDFSEHFSVALRDPEVAAEYLMAAIEESDLDYFKVALGRVAKAHGISNIAQITEIPRATLYNILQENSNPSLANIQEILGACGLTITVTSKVEAAEIRDLEKKLGANKSLPRTEVVQKIWNYIRAQGFERDIIEVGEKEIAKLAKKTHRLVKQSKSTKKSVRR